MSLLDLARVAAIERSIYDFPWTEGNFRDSLNAGHEGWLLESMESPGKLKAYALLMWIVDEGTRPRDWPKAHAMAPRPLLCTRCSEHAAGGKAE